MEAELSIINKIKSTIESFNSVSLDEINAVKLLNRTDTKYAFNIHKVPEFLEQIKDEYSVLTIENHRLMQYNSLYFDTEGLDLYTKHQNGKLNRYKVRIREYADTNTKLLETKFKTNKGRTIKIRQEKGAGFELNSIDKQFITEHTKVDPEVINPSVWVYYKRMTLVNKAFTERITLDVDLHFENIRGEKKGFPNIAIAEVKRDKLAKDSFFSQLLREQKIQNAGLSKYCLGVATTFAEAKVNNLKPKILTLKKIENQYV